MKTRMCNWVVIAAFAALACLSTVAHGEVLLVNFEELDLSPNSYWNGADGRGGFSSRGVSFNNSYNTDWGSWSGWAYSNVQDSTTHGWTNQYAAFPGTGYDSSSNYAVGYVGDPYYGGVIPSITLPDGWRVQSARFTNTTYAALSMRYGDAFAKKFGGDDGTKPDYFKLIVTGKDATGQPVGTVEFYLADYRFENNADDYIVGTWQYCDLSALSKARILEFTLESSDVGDWGMNTPAYFAMDNLTLVPEPSSALLLAIGLGTIVLGRWWRRRG
jgi:hypothetical protein